MAPWFLAGALIVGLLALNVTAVVAAWEIRREGTRRFDEVQRQLEQRANSIVDHIFDANRS